MNEVRPIDHAMIDHGAYLTWQDRELQRDIHHVFTVFQLKRDRLKRIKRKVLYNGNDETEAVAWLLRRRGQ
jgi:hypothetical protein